jgi:hypothetical protein
MRPGELAALAAGALVAACSSHGPGGGTGGSTATGRDGGGAVIPKPLPCNDLPGAGTFEQITPPAATGYMITSVAVDPMTPGTVYVGTGGTGGTPGSAIAGLWKSLDCGSTWTHIDTGKNGSTIDSGSLWWTMVDPTDSRVVYTTSGYGGAGLYKSTNGGVDFDDIRPTESGAASFVQVGAIDPSDHEHIVISFHDDCTGSFAPVCLAESSDGGGSWHLIKGPPQVQSWAEGGGPVVLGANLIIYDVPFAGMFSTTDDGMTWTQALGYPGCFPAFAESPADGAYYMGCLSPFGVAKSTDKGMTWTTIMGSPWGNGLAATTQYLYMTENGMPANEMPFFRAPLTDTTSWTNVATPALGYSANYLVYDSSHHVLYGANQQGGLWRGVTE